MCKECGCEKYDKKDIKKDAKPKSINIDKNVMDANDEIAHSTRHILLQKNILAINVLGSPGAGKTTFIEHLAMHISPEKMAVIQGDLESDIDKVRLEKQNIMTYQINTHSGCHLNAKMISDALEEMDLEGKEFLFIENVGNLVCPANVKIGQNIDIVISSTTEGSDKPKKYPVIFNNAKAVIISKSDLAEYVGFDKKIYLEDIKKINPKAELFEVTSKEKEGFKPIAEFMEKELDEWKHKAEHHHHH